MARPPGLSPPSTGEYAPYYAGYVGLVPEGDILDRLANQLGETVALLTPLDDPRARYRYAPEKWSVKEVVGHLIDTERVFAARALHMARRDRAPLPGFEQDEYVTVAQFDLRSLDSLLSEFTAVRSASVALFRGFGPDVWLERGVANDVEFTVRSFPYIIAGHELHHRGILRERYL